MGQTNCYAKHRLGEYVAELNNEGVVPPAFPDLTGCLEVKGEFGEQVGGVFARWLESPSPRDMKLLASIIDEIRDGFRKGRHRRDFAEFSRQLFAVLQESQPSLLQGIEPPPKTGNQNFTELDALEERLRAEAGRLEGVPVPPGRVATDPMIQQPMVDQGRTSPRSDGPSEGGTRTGFWVRMVVVVLLLGTVGIGLLIRRSRGRKTITGAELRPGRMRLPGPHGRENVASPAFQQRGLEPLPEPRVAGDLEVDKSGLDELKTRLKKLELDVRQIAHGADAGSLRPPPDRQTAVGAPATGGLASRTLTQKLNDLRTQFEGKIGGLERKVEEAKEGIRQLQDSGVHLLDRPPVDDPLATPEAARPAPDSYDPLEIEQRLLKMSWSSFSLRHGEVMELAKAYASEGGGKVRVQALLIDLQQAMEADPHLRRLARRVLHPVREYNRRLKLIGLAAKRAEGDFGSAKPDTQKLMLLRESQQLLSTFETTDSESMLLDFDLERWSGDEFTEVANAFLSWYQRAKSEGRSDSLERAYRIVVDTLRLGDLEPIEIALGETFFDSKLHEGRSREYDDRYPKGTILSVIKNGFKRASTGEIVRHAEVIVNQMG